MSAQRTAPPPPAPATIEVRVRELSQLFNSLDPSPFVEKDLDAGAEEYIVERTRDLPAGSAYRLVIHLEQPGAVPEAEGAVGNAIREHFSRQSRRLQRKLRLLLRRGLVSLAIGIGFLIAAFTMAELVGRLAGESGWARLLEQSLHIVGWVAMWRPLEIFLYDWWPISGERRIHDRLSRLPVSILPAPPSP